MGTRARVVCRDALLSSVGRPGEGRAERAWAWGPASGCGGVSRDGSTDPSFVPGGSSSRRGSGPASAALTTGEMPVPRRTGRGSVPTGAPGNTLLGDTLLRPAPTLKQSHEQLTAPASLPLTPAPTLATPGRHLDVQAAARLRQLQPKPHGRQGTGQAEANRPPSPSRSRRPRPCVCGDTPRGQSHATQSEPLTLAPALSPRVAPASQTPWRQAPSLF